MASSTTRTIFFSCPYAFNPIGATELRDRFKAEYEGPDPVPFLIHDDKNDLFSMTVDRHDASANSTALYFLAQLKVFTEKHIRDPDVIEPRISHKLDPTPRLQAQYSTDDGRNLLDIYDSEDSESAEEDALQAMSHLTTYWYPNDGNIKILTTSVAENIASLTGSSVYPEPQESRVRLVGGDFNAALRKLQNMEPLLALQHQQRSQKSPRANANIVLLTSDDMSMRLWPISDSARPAFTRLMVDARSIPTLEHKYICERFIIDDNGTRDAPENLRKSYRRDTEESAQSAIWNQRTYRSFGDESNTEPRVAPGQTPAPKKPTSPPAALIGANAFIEPVKAAQVAAWSGQITEPADPYTAKPPPVEERTSSRRRLVAPDSDDEDEDDKPVRQDAAPAPTPLGPEGSKGNADDLISICTTQPSGNVALGEEMHSPHCETGLLAFEDDPPASADLMENATLISNLLDQRSEIAPPSSPPSRYQNPIFPRSANPPFPHSTNYHFPRSTSKPNGTNNPFDILGSDEGGGLVDLDDPVAEPSIPAKPILASSDNRSNSTVVKASSNVSDLLQGPDSGGVWGTVTAARSKSSVGTNLGPLSHGLHVLELGQNSREEGSLPRDQTTISLSGNEDLLQGFAYFPQPEPAAGSGLGSRAPHNGGPSSSSSNARSLGIANPFSSNRDTGSSSRRSELGVFDSRLVYAGDNRPAQTDLLSAEETPLGCGRKRINLIDDRVDESVSGFKERNESSKSNLMCFSTAPGYRQAATGVPASPASQASLGTWAESKQYENHKPYRPNIKAHERAALEKLLGSKKASSSSSSSSTVPGLDSAASPARKAKSSRASVRSTMSQKASNPGGGSKKKKGKQAETAEEARLRRLKALEDAYGTPAVSSDPRTNASTLDGSAALTAEKQQQQQQQQLRQKAGPRLPPDVLAAPDQVAKSVTGALTPIFEAGRAFSGKLQFEVEVGQAMVAAGGEEITSNRSISAKTWDKLIGTPRTNGAMGLFTDLLTSNGRDIDRVLELKVKGCKIWDQARGEEDRVTYEFHCQSKQGQDFWLVVDEDGSFSVRNDTATIGMVAMHCPAQVWDAAAVLKGQEVWEHPPRAIAEAIEELVKSMYIPPSRRQLVLVFRQPKNLEITVRKVVLRRRRLYPSAMVECEQLGLQVSEVKTLATKIHPHDRRLWQAFEKEYQDVVDHNKLHYKLSIVDSSINAGLGENERLEVGELTSASCTGAKLLTEESVSRLVELTTLVLSKMDWVGAHNKGTQEQWASEKKTMVERQLGVLPHTALSRMQQPVLPASMVSGTAGHSPVAGTADNIPGPRAKTNAPVYRGSDGGLYAIGMGGAHVPLSDGARRDMGGGLTMIGEEIEPDDSASQYGVPKAVSSPGGLMRRALMNRGASAYGDSKEPGFW